jgi:hypothetical protein
MIDAMQFIYIIESHGLVLSSSSHVPFITFKYREKPKKDVVMLKFLKFYNPKKWSEAQVSSKVGEVRKKNNN